MAPGGVGLAAFHHRFGARRCCGWSGGRRCRGGHANASCSGVRGWARLGGVPRLAAQGGGVGDAGAVGGGQLGDVAFDPVDEPPDSGDLLLAGGGVGADPFIDAVDAGGEAFAGAQQVIEVGGQVGQVGDVGAEVVAAGAAEPDRAGAAAGLDVGRFGAGAVGHGDLADGIPGVFGIPQGGRIAPDAVAVPVKGHGGDLVDGVTAAVFADPVVAAGDVEV